MSRVCIITWVPKKMNTKEHVQKKTHKIAMNVVTLTTCKRSLAILGQHNTKKKVGASTKSKNCCHGCPKTWTVPYIAAQNSYQMIGRIKNMYKSEQYFVSMPKKHIFLQKGFFYSWRHLLTKCHCTPWWVLFFLMFNNSILSLQKASKRQTRWSYKMTWHLKTLTKWTLENPQLCLLGALLQKGLVRGLFVTTKWPYINHL